MESSMRNDLDTHWKSFLYLLIGTALFVLGIATVPDPRSPSAESTVTIGGAVRFAFGYVLISCALWVTSFIAMIIFVSRPSRALARKCLLASMSLLSLIILALGLALFASMIWYVSGHTGQTNWKPSILTLLAGISGGWLIGAAIRGGWRGLQPRAKLSQ